MKTISVTDCVYNQLKAILVDMQKDCKGLHNCSIDDLACIMLITGCTQYMEGEE